MYDKYMWLQLLNAFIGTSIVYIMVPIWCGVGNFILEGIKLMGLFHGMRVEHSHWMTYRALVMCVPVVQFTSSIRYSRRDD